MSLHDDTALKALADAHPDAAEALRRIAALPLKEQMPAVIRFTPDAARDFFAKCMPGTPDEEILELLRDAAANRMLASHEHFGYMLMELLEGLERGEHLRMAREMLAESAVILYHRRDLDVMDRCFALFNRLNADVLNREAMIMLHYQGLILHQKRYHYDSIRFYDRALHYAEGLGEWNYIARIYDSLGQAFGDKGLFKEAFEYYDRSIKSKRDAGDEEGLALTLGNKGRLHMQAGEYREAMDCFRKDLVISEKRGDVFGQIMMHSQIGQIHWIRWETEKALEAYHISHSLSVVLDRDHAQSDGIGFALMGLANCYLDLEDRENFEACMRQLRDFAEASRNRVLFLGQHHLLRGKALERREDLDGAEAAYLESLEYIPKFMSKVERGLQHERLAVLYGKKENKELCNRYLIDALRYFEESNAHRHIRRVNERMHQFDPEGWFLHLFKGFIGKRALEHVMRGSRDEGAYGREKETTILFSDIRDFTAWSESIQARDLVETLNDYLSVMTNAIERHRGDIDKYIGDAVMSVFEISDEDKQADAAANALRAAWNMFSELYMFNRVLADKHKPPIKMGVGIHSGKVISGTMGSSSRKNFTVIGDVVNTASRIEGLTRKYGVNILVSEDTQKLCADNPDFIFREVDTVRVKGKTRPIVVYELFHAARPEDTMGHGPSGPGPKDAG